MRGKPKKRGEGEGEELGESLSPCVFPAFSWLPSSSSSSSTLSCSGVVFGGRRQSEKEKVVSLESLCGHVYETWGRKDGGGGDWFYFTLMDGGHTRGGGGRGRGITLPKEYLN